MTDAPPAPPSPSSAFDPFAGDGSLPVFAGTVVRFGIVCEVNNSHGQAGGLGRVADPGGSEGLASEENWEAASPPGSPLPGLQGPLRPPGRMNGPSSIVHSQPPPPGGRRSCFPGKPISSELGSFVEPPGAPHCGLCLRNLSIYVLRQPRTPRGVGRRVPRGGTCRSSLCGARGPRPRPGGGALQVAESGCGKPRSSL